MLENDLVPFCWTLTVSPFFDLLRSFTLTVSTEKGEVWQELTSTTKHITRYGDYLHLILFALNELLREKPQKQLQACSGVKYQVNMLPQGRVKLKYYGIQNKLDQNKKECRRRKTTKNNKFLPTRSKASLQTFLQWANSLSDSCSWPSLHILLIPAFVKIFSSSSEYWDSRSSSSLLKSSYSFFLVWLSSVSASSSLSFACLASFS